MKKIANFKVLINGLNGTGAEIGIIKFNVTAKNLLLFGIKELCINDSKDTCYLDLSSQFFLNENDIGKNRAKQSLYNLKLLSPDTNIYN